MADYYSVGYTKYRAAQKVAPGTWKPKVCYDLYEAVAVAAASTIYMFIPPAGSRFKGGYLMTDLLGAGAELSVGIVGTVDKFMAAIDHGTAALKTTLPLIAAIGAVGYEFDGATPVIITTSVAEITGTITLVMEFFGVAL